MNPLRLFLRGLTRLLVRRSVRRMATNTRLPSSMRSRIDGRDDILDDIADQIDVLEALELAAEAPSIIANARDAASGGSVETFAALYEQFNPGQRALADNYCMDYAEEYWQSTDNPDPDTYLSGMYSLHEAIEQALSETCEMSYEAGRTAGAIALAESLSSYIAESLIARGMTMAGVRRAQSDWSRFNDDIAEAQIRGDFSGEGWITRGGEKGSFAHSMYIGTSSSEMHRQLSGRQFMGADQPYWFTENRRMQYAAMQGHMSRDDYTSKRTELYQATYKSPYSTTPPPGYRPYDGPEWEYRGN